MSFSSADALFLGTVLEAWFYGMYVLFFGAYLKMQRRKQEPWSDPVTVGTVLLFILCSAVFSMDVADNYWQILTDISPNLVTVWKVNWVESLFYSVIDCLSQMVLIYRCWIIWDKRYWMVIVPFFMSLAALGGELSLVGMLNAAGPGGEPSPRLFPTGTAAFSISLAVNAIVTLLIVTKVLIVTNAFRRTTSPGDRDDSALKIRAVVAMLIESGLTLLVAQMLWVITFKTQSVGFNVVGGSVTQIYGITPTVLAIRVRMRATYEDSLTSTSLVFSSHVVTQKTHSTNANSSTLNPSFNDHSDDGEKV